MRFHQSVGLQLASSGAVTGLSAIVAATPGVSRFELSLFRIVNRLPAILEVPLALIMQLGSLAAVPSSAGAAVLARRPVLATELAVAGGISWGAAKAVKIIVARERPSLLVTEVLLRGREQRGRGFPSGHAAVATALATVAGKRLGPATRRATWASVGAVAIARVYIGAHLPLDVVGGGALGSTIGSAVMSSRIFRGPQLSKSPSMGPREREGASPAGGQGI